jgi:hypothetical protein
MKLELNLGVLRSLMHRMGASYRKWTPKAIRQRGISIPNINIEIDLAGLEQLERDPETGVFLHNGHAVVLYIRDSYKTKEILEQFPEKGPKYHICDCWTINDMKARNRFERYVISNNRSGRFRVGYVGEPRNREITGFVEDVPLRVCKNCLARLYPKRSKEEIKDICDNFDLGQFLDKQDTRFADLPSRRADSSPPDNYPDDWDRISARYRQSVGWVCERCGVDLSAPEHHRLLQTHHVNGVRSYNNRSNLRALCVLCHSESPSHHHMRVKPEDRELIESLRREQGIIPF